MMEIEKKYQLSQRLINRLVKKPCAAAAGASGNENRRKKIEDGGERTIEVAKKVIVGHEIESMQDECAVNFHLFRNDRQVSSKGINNLGQMEIEKDFKDKLPNINSLSGKVKCEEGFVNLSHAKLGDLKCTLFLQKMGGTQDEEPDPMKHNETASIKSIFLKDNRLTDKGMSAVLNAINSIDRFKNLLHLDISSNKISSESAASIADCVCQLSLLERLNISNMNLGDKALKIIFDKLGDDETRHDSHHNIKPVLRSLKLSHNGLRYVAPRALAKFLTSHSGTQLLELDVSWNLLDVEGASVLWPILNNHEYLISLDLSRNSLGDRNHEETTEKIRYIAEVNPLSKREDLQELLKNGKEKPAVRVVPRHGLLNNRDITVKYASANCIAELLKNNDALLHLNISYNSFCAKECQIIGEGLKDNHTLLGIHITGNSGRIDSHGFMTADTDSWSMGLSHYSEPIIVEPITKEYHNSIRGQSPIYNENYYNDEGLSARNSCWICNGWAEVEFAYELSKDDIKKLKETIAFNAVNYTVHRTDKISDLFPVHLFASFDNWQPERMWMPAPSDLQAQTKAAPVLCTLQERMQVPHSANSSPVRRKLVHSSPKSPGPKPTRSPFRRRSSLPQRSGQEDMGYVVPIDEIQQMEMSKVRKASIASYSESQRQKLHQVLNMMSSEKPSSTTFTKSSAEVTATDGDKDGEKSNKENVLLYDDMDMKTVSSKELQSRQSKTIEMISSFHPITESKNRWNQSEIREINRSDSSFLNASSSHDQRIDDDNLEGKRWIYRLRRMVPPGRHAYAFSVGVDFQGDSDSDKPNTVFDQKQPSCLTSVALSQCGISIARAQGVSLPKNVNIIEVSKVIDRNNSAVPSALLLSSRLSHPVNPKPRVRKAPTIGQRKKLWNRMESVLYKQWVNHQRKYLMECFFSDWRQSSTCVLLMGDTSEETERHEVMNCLKEHYGLLKGVYDYYWAVYSPDMTGLNGIGYNEIIKKCQILKPYADQIGLSHLNIINKKGVQSKRRRSSFPPEASVEVKNDMNSETSGNEKDLALEISPAVKSKLFDLASKAKKIVAMSPRETKAIMAPRSSAIMKQLTLSRSIREVSTSDDSDNSDMDSIECSQSSAVEKRLSIIEQNQTTTNDLKSDRKKSIIGGKVMEACSLPWKEGNGDGSCNLSDVDMIFISNCMTGPKAPVNNKRALLRHQFMDCIVSLACMKYLNSKICKRMSLAIDMFIGNNLGRLASRRNDERFIKVILPSRAIDAVLSYYLSDLKKAFTYLSTPVASNPAVRTLSLQTWLRLCESAGFSLGDRQLKMCFIFSKVQGIVDVFGPAYHMNEIQFVEFIEALTRVAYAKQTKCTEKELGKTLSELDTGELNEFISVTKVSHVLKEVIKLVLKLSKNF